MDYGDTPAAATRYRLAAEQGHSIAQHSLGFMYVLGLIPSGKMPMASAHGVSPVNVYLVDILLPFGDPTTGAQSSIAESMQVMEFQPNNSAYQALVGRDIMCKGLFIMSGYDKRFTICM